MTPRGQLHHERVDAVMELLKGMAPPLALCVLLDAQAMLIVAGADNDPEKIDGLKRLGAMTLDAFVEVNATLHEIAKRPPMPGANDG